MCQLGQANRDDIRTLGTCNMSVCLSVCMWKNSEIDINNFTVPQLNHTGCISASRREKANAIAMWPILTWLLLLFSCCLVHCCSCLCDPDSRPCRRANATVQIASEEDLSSDSGPSNQTDIILPSTTRVHQTSDV